MIKNTNHSILGMTYPLRKDAGRMPVGLSFGSELDFWIVVEQQLLMKRDCDNLAVSAKSSVSFPRNDVVFSRNDAFFFFFSRDDVSKLVPPPLVPHETSKRSGLRNCWRYGAITDFSPLCFPRTCCRELCVFESTPFIAFRPLVVMWYCLWSTLQ